MGVMKRAVPLNGSYYFITEADMPSSVTDDIPPGIQPIKPPRNATDKQIWDWTVTQLEWGDRAYRGKPPDPGFRRLFDFWEAIAEANCGNMEPLRKLHPELATLPPPKINKRFQPGRQWRILCARGEARYRIKTIWKDNGIKYQREMAIKIAAEPWGIQADAIRKGLPSESAKLRRNVKRRQARKAR
jgi:hypothetical protein